MLKLFIRVARRGSFSAVARELAVAQSSVSRSIALLEEEIGTKLLVRSTRSVVLTDRGAEYLSRVEPLLAELDDATQLAGGPEMRGVLRVGVSSSVAVRLLIPLLPNFMARHPALTVDLAMSDQRQDLVAEGVDLAMRIGTLTDSTATARYLCSFPRLLVAAPGYLARAGAPTTPDELLDHPVVLAPGLSQTVQFKRGGETRSLRLSGRLKVDVNEGAVAAAVAGLGIAMTSLGACRKELAEASLIRVLPDWDLGQADLHAVFTNGRSTKRSARVFADYLELALRQWPMPREGAASQNDGA